MRSIKHDGKTIDYTVVSQMSQNYDAKNFSSDTEYIIFNCAVLGNATGAETVEGDDGSSALAAIHGRKYNNARIAIPFTREFIERNYSKIDSLIQVASEKMSGTCAQYQSKLSPEQVSQGRELSMRSQAIREAKTELTNSGIAVDGEQFSIANRSVRGRAGSKVYFQYGMSVSGRRVNQTEGLDKKGNYKRKNVKDISGAQFVAYVSTADESGLKKVPIFSRDSRTELEQVVYNFALVVKEEIDKLPSDWSEEAALTAMSAIIDKMPGKSGLSYEIPEYTEAEQDQIKRWKDEIIKAYTAI